VLTALTTLARWSYRFSRFRFRFRFGVGFGFGLSFGLALALAWLGCCCGFPFSRLRGKVPGGRMGGLLIWLWLYLSLFQRSWFRTKQKPPCGGFCLGLG